MRPTTPDLARAAAPLRRLTKPAPVYTAFDNTRRVWAALTSDPQISTRRLAKRLKMAPSTIWRHVRALVDAGYVEQHGRARRVIVPMYSAIPRGKGIEVF